MSVYASVSLVSVLVSVGVGGSVRISLSVRVSQGHGSASGFKVGGERASVDECDNGGSHVVMAMTISRSGRVLNPNQR